jgi:hypothetical protein
MNKLRHLGRCLPFLVALATLPACTHTAKINVKPTALPSHARHAARAALVLDDSLSKYQFEFKMAGDKFVFPFGPALTGYAKNVSQHCFSKVTTYPTGEAATGQDADLILHPRALKAEHASGMMAWSDRKLTLQVEWVARDRSNKNTVWLQSFTAEGVNSAGNLFTGKKHEEVLYQRLFDDLSLKTVEAIQNSPELKAVSTNTKP